MSFCHKNIVTALYAAGEGEVCAFIILQVENFCFCGLSAIRIQSIMKTDIYLEKKGG